ncbi:MAG: hypothetical protein N3A38_15190, partial [Planctomycetota bacterium]|nr:hypothetical protein [Planctomycetota bacterium]
LNLYSYASGDPANAWDPWGLKIIVGGVIEPERELAEDDVAGWEMKYRDLALRLMKSPQEYRFPSYAHFSRQLRTRYSEYACKASSPQQEAPGLCIAGFHIGTITEAVAERAAATVEGLDVILSGETCVAVEQIQSEMADRIAKVMVWDESELSGYAVLAGDLSGVTTVGEAIYGVDVGEAVFLEAEERISRGLLGGGYAVLVAVGGTGAASGARVSFAAGWKGLGLKEAVAGAKRAIRWEGVGRSKFIGQLRAAVRYEGTGLAAASRAAVPPPSRALEPIGARGVSVHEQVVAEYAAKHPPVVIGENMKRVNFYARKIGGQTIDDWLAGRPWSQKLNDDFIAAMKSQGREFTDIGPDFSRRLQRRINPTLGHPPSAAYGSERQLLLNYENYRRVYCRFGKYQGGVPGFDF